VTVEGLGRYDVAEVVVFESDEADTNDLYLVYDYTRYDAITVGYDAEAEAYDTEMYVDVEDVNENGKIEDEISVIDYYTIWSDGEVKLIDKDYADEYIYAGKVVTNNDVNKRDYIKVAVAPSSVKYFYEDETTIYVVDVASNGDYVIEEAEYDVEIGDELIILTNSKGTIQYIINVTQSVDSDEVQVAAAKALWNKIYRDAMAVAETYTVNNVGEYAYGDTAIVENMTGEFAKVTDADGVRWAPVVGGEAEIKVYSNTLVEGGYYDFVVDGETYYTTETGKMYETDLLTAADVEGTGTYFKWTYADGATVISPKGTQGNYLVPSEYAYNELETGYVKVDILGEVSYEKAGTVIDFTNTGDVELVAQVGYDYEDLLPGEPISLVVGVQDITIYAPIN